MGVYAETCRRRYDTHDFSTFCYSGYVVTNSMHLHIYQKFIGTVHHRQSRSKAGRFHWAFASERFSGFSPISFHVASDLEASTLYCHFLFPYIWSPSSLEMKIKCSG